ncbi:tetratricopeptide repeat protein [Loktanella sp. DJP18]|uniref:tetratricopeptide repeat protein n=1 Tax=Loktanella sp. DJP18 TaxID=3409788 RepID=UPI003BB75DA3
MLSFRHLTLCVLLIFGTVGLAGCKNDAERAADYFQSAQALLASGDVERAKVELRNVFENDAFHEPARRTLAQLLLDDGDLAGAYQQYRYIAEAQPDLADVRLTMAELALKLGDLTEARTHFAAADAIVPDDPRARVLKAAFDYQNAADSGDSAAMSTAADKAGILLAELPDNEIAQRVVIDSLLQSGDPQAALPEIEKALTLTPDDYQLNLLKLRLLNDADNIAGTGAQLQTMVELFPDNEELAGDLIRWYMSQNDTAGAESFLRDLAGDDTGPIDGHLSVVQFLQVTQGDAAARAELDRLATANADADNADIYRALAAVIDFGQGQKDGAIATLEGILADATASDQTSRIRMMLSQMLAETGNIVGARAQIEQVLAADPTNVAALKMRAAGAIRDDDPTAALVDLRAAVDQSPQDAEIMTLMADAYIRDGNKDLAGERLAQAVNVSKSAAPESLRYARFLLQDGRNAAALNVLADARTANPGNVEILSLLGERLLAQESWVQVQRVIGDLNEAGTPAATEAAKTLQTALLVAQNRLEEGVDFLQGAITGGDADTRTVLQMIQLQLRAGDISEARRVLDSALAATPDDDALKLLDANLKAAEGNVAGAEDGLRDAIARLPEAEAPVQMLYNLLRGQDRTADASDVLTAALDRMPQAGTLAVMRAGELETAGDIEGAIAIYDDLYARNSGNVIVANNLASLIATHRDDPESLARAEAIARRLRSTDVPAFQDTYGWIAYRQDNLDEALTYLESAAAGLPDDPLVQFHLGMVYVALDRPADARPVLTRALEIAGDSTLPQFATARETLAGLPAATPEAGTDAAVGTGSDN